MVSTSWLWLAMARGLKVCRQLTVELATLALTRSIDDLLAPRWLCC